LVSCASHITFFVAVSIANQYTDLAEQNEEGDERQVRGFPPIRCCDKNRESEEVKGNDHYNRKIAQV
jgi:hypothetical protein